MSWSKGSSPPVGDRDYGTCSPARRHRNGQNVQVVADLDGLLADVGDPVPGARHDSVAFHLSGIAHSGQPTDQQCRPPLIGPPWFRSIH